MSKFTSEAENEGRPDRSPHLTREALGMVDRAETLAEQVYSNVKVALMNGELAPGVAISARRIADMLDVSLTPAREALMRLAAERALRSDPRRRFTVPRLDRCAFCELLDIRVMLEGRATEVAASRMQPQQVEELAEINSEFTDAINSAERKMSLQLNRRFHFYIYSKTEMPELYRIIESLWTRAGPMFNFLHPEYQSEKRGLSNHMAALAAIRNGDALTARAAIERDLHEGAEYLFKLLDDHDPN